ncbi:MAG: sulfotransferase [Cyanobacteria bacterium J06592_8]
MPEISMSSLWKSSIKPYLRTIRTQIIGEDWKEQIKPVEWYNFPSWVQHTIADDFKHYRSKDRPWSLQRFQGLLFPNLKKPVFIFGAPRSGTTFLGKCLGELPELSYHYEPVLTKAVSRYVYTNQWSKAQAQFLYKSVYRWLMRLHTDGDLRFVEKTPRNSLILPFLYETFPDGRFIHIIRDGRDAALSLAKKPWYRNDKKGCGAKDPSGYPFGPMARFWVKPEEVERFETTNDVHRCVWLWRVYVNSALEAASNLPSDQYYELKYEDLVMNPNNEAEGLLDFLEIEKTESRTQFSQFVTRKASRDSVGTWKQELSDLQNQEVEQEAGQLLKQLEYIL